jgi:hypothetical protein
MSLKQNHVESRDKFVFAILQPKLDHGDLSHCHKLSIALRRKSPRVTFKRLILQADFIPCGGRTVSLASFRTGQACSNEAET